MSGIVLELAEEKRHSEREREKEEPPQPHGLPPPPPTLVSRQHRNYQMLCTWKWADGLFGQDPRASQGPPGGGAALVWDLLGDLGSTCRVCGSERCGGSVTNKAPALNERSASKEDPLLSLHSRPSRRAWLTSPTPVPAMRHPIVFHTCLGLRSPHTSVQAHPSARPALPSPTNCQSLDQILCPPRVSLSTHPRHPSFPGGQSLGMGHTRC